MDALSPDAVEPPANVLFLHDSRTRTDGCSTMCTHDDRTALLQVSFAGDDVEPVRGPETHGLLTVGDVIRAAEAAGEPDFTGPVAVDVVSDPTDVAAIGVSISNFCKQWYDQRIGVCFHSLDALLRQTDPETIFEFSYYLNRRLESVGALAHFHLDPAQHPDRVVAAFGEIFDHTVVDESASDALPEATDDEVAELLADIEAPESPEYPWEQHGVSEATEEEMERLLGG
ncbi:DUF7504 family protein [Halovivax gelatinilyticus]|uniref:DUF7504 family protein n=1 Tax=Halovivax gelatinilyticus TaxID=2961597 RepID=UPI0020CA62A4|nr:hypothetical protein [Halovivax gelatinilyticus]